MDVNASSGVEVVLDIDELMLTGVDPRDAQRVAAAVRSELERLLADPAAAIRPGSARRDLVEVESPRPAAGAPPEAVGAAIAESIFRGVAQ